MIGLDKAMDNSAAAPVPAGAIAPSRKRRAVQDEDDDDDSDPERNEIASAAGRHVASRSAAEPPSGLTTAAKRPRQAAPQPNAKPNPAKKQLTLSSFFTKKAVSATPVAAAASPKKISSHFAPAATQPESPTGPSKRAQAQKPASGPAAEARRDHPTDESPPMMRKRMKQRMVISDDEDNTGDRCENAQDREDPERLLDAEMAPGDEETAVKRRSRRVRSENTRRIEMMRRRGGGPNANGEVDGESGDDSDSLNKENDANDDGDPMQEDSDGGDGAMAGRAQYHASFGLSRFKRGANSKAPTIAADRSDKMERTREKFLARFLLNDTVSDEAVHDEADAPDEDADESSGEDERSKSKPKTPIKSQRGTTSATAAKSKNAKWTPLEMQYHEIKKKHPDCMLVVEVGYKYRFFGDDAINAAKALNIVAYMDKNLHGASIPIHRLNVHVKKLVQLGYKVGIVRQIETAAIKASGDNKSGPFTRKLTNIYTRGTYVDDVLEDDSCFEVKSSFVLCLNEEKVEGSDEKVQISLVAVQLSTGEVIHDVFEDGFMRNELETRLQHIQPVEILLPFDPLSKSTEKIIAHWSLRAPGEDGVRLERLKNAFLKAAEARVELTSFYEKPLKVKSPSIEESMCLGAMLHYLREFSLEQALFLTKSFESFSSVGHMVLSGNTLTQLEIFQSDLRDAAGSAGKGSLFWVLDHTITRFGGRLLRKWIRRPLVKVSALNERVNALEELIECIKNQNQTVMKLTSLLTQLPDLEKGLARIHYARCTPPELLGTLQAFEKISTSIPPSSGSQFKSKILADVFDSPSTIRSVVQEFLGQINRDAAKANAKLNLFSDDEAFPEVAKLREALLQVEADFQEILKDIRKKMKMPSLQYTSVSGTDYQIEIKSQHVKSVPSSWQKISALKSVSRFHPPEVLEKIKEKNVLSERLAAAVDSAFLKFLHEVAEKYEDLRAVVQSMAVADCLLSMAKVASQPGYVKPLFCEDPVIEVKNSRHPMVENLVNNFVPNDIHLNAEERCLLITGPNMGGKSSYIRQVALIAIMGQIGSYVPADSATLGIFDSVHTRMGASDDIGRGQSTFMKELEETSDIIRSATARSLVILDELGRGTSTHDGTAIAFATLRYMVETVRCTTLFVTHYPILGSLAGVLAPALRCAHMGFMEDAGESQGEDPAKKAVVFLYRLTGGLATRSYGLNVARLAGLTPEILDVAAVKSSELEESNKSRQQSARVAKRQKCFASLWRLSKGEADAVLEELSTGGAGLIEDGHAGGGGC
ncbi:muts domain V-domain-containing protein [Zopfochytrium polystomum]|nr:muts domain V-domain-containing protein [Zopfochytrium polystomum]